MELKMILFSDDEKVVFINLNEQKSWLWEMFWLSFHQKHVSGLDSSLLDLTDPSLLFLLSTPHIILFCLRSLIFLHHLLSPFDFQLSKSQKSSVVSTSLSPLLSSAFSSRLLLSIAFNALTSSSHHHSFSLPSFIYFLLISSSISSFLQHHRICILLPENQTADLQLYSEWGAGTASYFWCVYWFQTYEFYPVQSFKVLLAGDFDTSLASILVNFAQSLCGFKMSHHLLSLCVTAHAQILALVVSNHTVVAVSTVPTQLEGSVWWARQFPCSPASVSSPTPKIWMLLK